MELFGVYIPVYGAHGTFKGQDFVTFGFCAQVSCHLIPQLVKLRKEGIDGNEKIKKYTFVSSPLFLLSGLCSRFSRIFFMLRARRFFSPLCLLRKYSRLKSTSVNL